MRGLPFPSILERSSTLRGAVSRGLSRLAVSRFAPIADPFLLKLGRAFDSALTPLYGSYFEFRFRTAGATLTMPLRNGLRFTADPRDYPQKQILVAGIWEPSISQYVESILRPGDVVVDVGANTGYYTLFLDRNVAQNNLGQRVVAFQCAATQRLEAVRIAVYEGRSGSTSITSALGDGTEPVDERPLDDIVDGNLATRIRLIKIDVEGAELAVLRGATETLRRIPASAQLIVEVSFDESGRSGVVDLLRELGYRTFLLQNRYWPLEEQMLPSRAVAPEPRDSFELSRADALFVRARSAS